MKSTNKPNREVRYDPNHLIRAIRKCAANIKMFEEYIRKQKEEKKILEDALEKELAIREQEGTSKPN